MTRTVIALAATLACAAPAGFAQDASGRTLAASCAICHGPQGRSVSPELVSLAGLPREHIASQMRAFRDGQRPATVMHQIAKGYSDAEINAMAAWFAAQKR